MLSQIDAAVNNIWMWSNIQKCSQTSPKCLDYENLVKRMVLNSYIVFNLILVNFYLQCT